jgi:hypothetical protein
MRWSANHRVLGYVSKGLSADLKGSGSVERAERRRTACTLSKQLVPDVVLLRAWRWVKAIPTYGSKMICLLAVKVNTIKTRKSFYCDQN